MKMQPIRLHWIKDDGLDDPSDLCAHSPVIMEINKEMIVSPDDGDWTVSASSLLLLRSIFRDHKGDMEDEEHIFPCCGHFIIPNEDREVHITGCPNGIDFSIIHMESDIELKFEAKTFRISKNEWCNTVIEFSDKVQKFYRSSQSKILDDDFEREGFEQMMNEWSSLRKQAEQVGAVDG